MEKFDEKMQFVDSLDGQPAPEAVLDLLACTCPRICKLPQCPCMVNGLLCTDICQLQNCDNKDTEIEYQYDTDDDNST